MDPRTLLGTALLWALLDRSATWSGSTRGEHGIAIACAVVACAVAIERLVHRTPAPRLIAALGLARPRMRGILVAIAIALVLALYFPIVSCFVPVTLRPTWPIEAIGIFAQAGIAEETIFRGYLYGHLRERRSAARAAWLSAIPFVAVHILLFARLDPIVAATATLLSAAIAIPLARLRELGGTWAPAIVHFAIQGFVKLVDVPADRMPLVAIGWMALAAIVPWLALARQPPEPYGRVMISSR